MDRHHHCFDLVLIERRKKWPQKERKKEKREEEKRRKNLTSTDEYGLLVGSPLSLMATGHSGHSMKSEAAPSSFTMNNISSSSFNF